MSYAGITMSGFADGSFIKITANEDDFSLKVGADGDACRVRKRNTSAKIELTLLQSSLSNAVLSLRRNLDITTPLGLAAAPLEIVTSSGSRFFAHAAWIMKMPDVEYSKDVGDRAWTFECGSMDSFIAGEVPLSG